MTDDLKESLTAKDKWLRLIFILLFAVAFKISGFLLGIIVVLQFLFVLFANKANENLLDFSNSLAQYIQQLARYLSYQTDARPFPFNPWPEPQTPPPPSVITGEEHSDI